MKRIFNLLFKCPFGIHETRSYTVDSVNGDGIQLFFCKHCLQVFGTIKIASEQR